MTRSVQRASTPDGVVGRAKWPRVVELRVAGRSPTEIATELGVSVPAVSRTLRLPEVVEAIDLANAEIRASVVQKLASAATEAVQGLVEIARGEPDENGAPTVPAAVRRAAWSDILGRAGHSPKVHVEHSQAVARQSQAAINLAGMPLEDVLALADIAEAELKARGLELDPALLLKPSSGADP